MYMSRGKEMVVFAKKAKCIDRDMSECEVCKCVKKHEFWLNRTMLASKVVNRGCSEKIDL